MDLLGKDAIILGKLVHSLGVIVYASRNTVVSMNDVHYESVVTKISRSI